MAATAQSIPVKNAFRVDLGHMSQFCTVKGNLQVEIRPIHPEDEERMIMFHQGLSERSVYMRYFESLSLAARTKHHRLARVCLADPQSETVLIALCVDPKTASQRIVAVGRLSRFADPSNAELALLVLDEFQGRGVGTELLRHLILAARNQKIRCIYAEMLRDNIAIQRLLRKLGFHLRLVDPRSVRGMLTI
jgi:acetyltransferase